ncbi:hypothetical protein J3454_05485 [Erythrobacter sp. NFXS35]|uniref:hypothetical protein n=1 Tax=Erythrobacter sp. NFXS35 TaxID=2818436 RepID=UPI0032DE7C47
MNKLKSIVFASSAILLASGCMTANPRIISADDRGITYRVKSDNQSAARDNADDYCQKWNRNAELRSVTGAGNDRSILTFACI